MIKISEVQHARLRDAIAQHVRTLNNRYWGHIAAPRMSAANISLAYTVTGFSAGRARWFASKGEWFEIALNPGLLETQWEDMLKDTLPHEVAHIATWLAFGPQVASHGWEWSMFAHLLGLDPAKSVKHHYPLAECRAARSKGVAVGMTLEDL